MKTISDKRKLFHRLLYALGALEVKPDILASYGAESTKDLEEYELDQVINRLQYGFNNRKMASDETRKWRSNVLTLLTRIGVYNNDRDWARVNKFMLNPKIAGKLLYEMNPHEMKTLCGKLRKIAQKEEEKRKKQLKNLNLN